MIIVDRSHTVYDMLMTLPDKLYPFSVTANHIVYVHEQAYDYIATLCTEEYGYAYFCGKLLLRRQLFHFLGAITIIIISMLILSFTKNRKVAIALVYCTIAYITMQEIYIHPRYNGQVWRKGIIDCTVRFIPLFLYVRYHHRRRISSK